MKRLARHIHRLMAGHDEGSVLTEFIIVAPVYLLLFGGLLLMCDMLMLKNKIVMLDQFITIAGTHRLMQGNDESAISNHIKSVFNGFMPGSVSSPASYANLYQSHNNQILANRWNAVYAGRIDVEYHLPDMIYELLSVQRVLFGDEKYTKQPTSYRFYADPTTGEFPGSTLCRYHIIQRNWTPQNGESGFNRAADAKRLIGDSILSNVVGDGWLFTEDTLGTETSSGNDVTYKQQLGSYAE